MNSSSNIRALCKISIRLFIFLSLPVYSFAQSNTCAGATVITSSTGCINTAGTLVGSTYAAVAGACGAAGGNRNDVW